MLEGRFRPVKSRENGSSSQGPPMDRTGRERLLASPEDCPVDVMDGMVTSSHFLRRTDCQSVLPRRRIGNLSYEQGASSLWNSSGRRGAWLTSRKIPLPNPRTIASYAGDWL